LAYPHPFQSAGWGNHSYGSNRTGAAGGIKGLIFFALERIMRDKRVRVVQEF